MPTIAGYATNEKISENPTTAVFRAHHPVTGQTVVLKLLKGNHPQNALLNRLRQEYALISSFDSRYIIKTYGLERHRNSLVMILEDCWENFVSLAEMVSGKRIAIDTFLHIALEITRALEVVHRNNIIYRNLNPANILISSDGQHIKLIDFNIATSDKDSRQPGGSLMELPHGTLPYISPEQTGRLEQAIDYRTDFYSLGVTLFQLATGSLPFAASSPAEVIHAHLAQTPPAPRQLRSTIPQVVSSIILKLLEKTTSRRYQNCHGIIEDLRRCLRERQEDGTISDFEPGEYDVSYTLNLPSHLYQRDEQLQMLRAGLENAAGGSVEIFVVSGPSGVGKSSLIHMFKKSLTWNESYFLRAEFEPIIPNTPYTAISWALRQLIRQVLSESATSITRWKTCLQQALKDEGGVLRETVPELEHLLGPQEAVADLGPKESERRFIRIFRKFFQVCCQIGPPLILFLDDLHRADAASLMLLEQILCSSDISRLMFIGTCAEAATVSENPLQHLLLSLSAKKLNVRKIVLDNLQPSEIENLLSLTLALAKEDVTDLAGICFQKTGGNPFYLRQFLSSINREGCLFYSPGSQRWQWDAASVQNSHSTENIAHLVIQRMGSLPQATCELLKTASCLGDTFSLQLLTTLHEYRLEESVTALRYALEQGVILTSADAGKATAGDSCYHFAHAHIRQAIRSRLNQGEQTDIRFRAGKHLLSTLPEEDYDRRINEIASHLNSGIQHITSRVERLEIARVNLEAGQKAKHTGDYSAARAYIRAGLHILPERSWQTEYSLTLELFIEGCETAFLCGAYSEVEKYFQTVCTEATGIYDKCRVYSVRVKALKAQSLPEHAVSACLEILSMLGVRIPAQPGMLRILSSLIFTQIRLMRYSQSRLLALPQIENRKVHTIMGFLHAIETAAYSVNPRLLPLLSAHAIRLSLKHGNGPESSIIGYLTHGFLLCSLSGRYINQGYRFGQLALQLQEQLNKGVLTGQTAYVYSSFISHWKEHVVNTLTPLTLGLTDCLECGDRDSAANVACSISFRHYLLGTNLDRIRAEIDEHHELVRQLSQQVPLIRLKIFGQAVANLRGENEDPTVLKGQYYNEDEHLADHLASGDYTSYCLAVLVKMMHAVLFNDYRQAIIHSDRARRCLSSLTASVFIPVYHFYDSLARLACYDQLNTAQRLRTRLVVHKNQRKMRRWAHHAPQNYSHKYSLVEAERERVRGNTERAMEWYDHAIHLAREHGYQQEEALAYEFAARFYNSRRKAHIARPYMREAHYCYYSWGATAKVRQLDSLNWATSPDIAGSSPVTLGTTPLTNTLIPGEGGSRLDMLTVIKASRILSSEMVLDELLKKMMRIMLESGGAQRGFLIFKENDGWVIKVRGSTYRSSIVTLTNTPVASQNIASTAIINYVIHAAMDVVLNDACKEGTFTNDSYIIKKKPRSVLCMPIIHQGEIFCILYLENNLATGAFPPDRQELLHLLGTQAAISLKNSRLFEDLEGAVGRLNSEVEKRRSTQLQLLHAEKLTALGRLSASIAHEFGNPLMGVKYLLDDFHQRKDISDDDRRLLELGLEECRRMKQLIQNLQRLNEPSTGKLTRIDMHQLIENVLFFQKKYFSSNRIRLKKQYDHSIPKVKVIVDQITQVLFNLTMNAVDAMHEEGGVLTITTRPQEYGLVVYITDTGTGIPYADQERIFEPFYSTKKEEDGTGLGLSISYGIAKHHGGNLSFTSRPGKGTTFTLFLPGSPETAIGLTREKENS